MNNLTENVFTSINHVKVNNKNFFGEREMKFFNSKLHTGLLKGKYFITSEQFISSTGDKFDRLFSIREAVGENNINTIGDFQQYKSLSEAKKAVNNI